MMKYFSIVIAAIVFTACGGGAKKGGLTKDTKTDYHFNQAALDSLAGIDFPEADRAKYEGKIIEIKGIVKGVKNAQAPSPNKFSFYLLANPGDEVGAVIYTDDDPTSWEGKTVTVKGKFDYAGVVTLDDSVVY